MKKSLLHNFLLVTCYLLLASPVFAQNEPRKISDLVDVIRRIIGILAPAVSIIFLLMVLMAAFRFIKSTGDPKKIASARDTLKYAAFGAILVAAAWLVLLAINTLTGANVTQVEIPGAP